MNLSVATAAKVIHEGKVIAYPTEAIYGLGCDPLNLDALSHLLNLKSRDSNKGLILIANNWEQLAGYVDLDDPAMLERANNSWPGPVTWIMPASAKCSTVLTGGRDTIAVRVSAHPVVRDLCSHCECALVSTSANISGEPPLLSATDIVSVFSDQIAGVLDGELGGLKNATSIFDARSGVQLR